MNRKSIASTEASAYFFRYLNLVPEDKSVLACLKEGHEAVMNFFSDLSEEQMSHRYAPEKWSVKELLQHLIDTERIFAYRCLRIARRDVTPLPSYDENAIVPPSQADAKTTKQLLQEYTITRQATISLVESLREEDLAFIGNASGNPLSARAAVMILPGHEIWHMDKVRELYL